MGGAVFERALQLQHHLAGAVTLEPFVGDGRPGDVAAELLQFFTLIGSKLNLLREPIEWDAKKRLCGLNGRNCSNLPASVGIIR